MAVTKIGSYNVLRALGRGPLGQSYLAEDRHDGRRVVIKLLPGKGEANSIIEEARKIGALSHAGIAMSQVGLHDNEPFIAIEYLEGESLGAWLKEKHSPTEQLRILAGVADALSHAHQQGVLHRALKPSNVHVLPDGWCKLVDFAVGTETGAKTGDPAYLAPEVLQGQPGSEKADIYSAGVLFYEVLSGKNPFLRETPAATAAAVQSVQPTPLSELRKDVKRDLSDAIMACLEKDPDWRPKDLSYVLELVRGLDPPKGSSAKSNRAPARPAAAPAGPNPLPSFGARPAPSPSRLPMVGGFVAVLALGAGAWFWLNRTPGTPVRPGASLPSAAPVSTVASPTPEPSASPEAAPTAQRTPTPGPSPAAGHGASPVPGAATPVPAAPLDTPRPTPAPTPASAATPNPLPTAAPTPLPTPEPVTTQPAVVEAETAEPTVLRNLTPPSLRRKAMGILDVHGSGFRTEHRAVILRGRDVPQTINVVRLRLVSPNLMQVALQVDDAAAPGAYTIAFADSQGRVSNSLRFEVAK